MIRPTKHMNLDLCVLNIAAGIIETLQASHVMRYDEVLARLQASLSDLVRFDFIPAVDLLYSLGIIDYSAETDSILLIRAGRGPVGR